MSNICTGPPTTVVRVAIAAMLLVLKPALFPFMSSGQEKPQMETRFFIEETVGLPRAAWPVSFGVPFGKYGETVFSYPMFGLLGFLQVADRASMLHDQRGN